MAQIISTGKQRAAKSSRIGVNSSAQILAFASWDVTVNGDDLETRNFQSFVSAPAGWNTGEAFDEGILGFVGADVKFGGLWDAGMNPLADPPGLYPRDNLANVSFWVSLATLDNTYWSWPYLRLRSTTNTAEVKGAVAFSCGGKNQGQFVFPSGSV